MAIQLSYDFQLLNCYLLSMIYTLLPSWIPGGKFNNKAYLFLSPFRPDKNIGSCSINVETGAYYDFANGDSCHDLISFYARLNNISNCEAYKVLSALYSQEKITNSSKYPTYTRQKPDQIINNESITRKDAKLLEVWFKKDQPKRDTDRFHVYDQNDDYLDCLPEGKFDVHHSRTYWHTKVYKVLKGKNWSVAGLKEPHYYPVIPIDIDDELNPVGTLISVFNRLLKAGIDSNAIKVYFSGNRGFHVTFYDKVIDKLNGRIDTSDKIAELILKPLFGTSIDLQNYKCNGLIRYVNSIHPKSGLYKIPLLKKEVNSELTLDYCRNIATKQRFTNE